MEAKVKVVLLCSCGNQDDPMYGSRGVLFFEYAESSGIPLDFVSFAGQYIAPWSNGEKLFLEECRTADVVILDAWNMPVEEHKKRDGKSSREAQHEMAELARKISVVNPFVEIFAELMENYEVEVHKVATAIYGWRSPMIAAAIRRAATCKDLPKVLVMDDSPIHSGVAKIQLSKEYRLAVVKEFGLAERILENTKFEIALLDLMVPAPDKAQPQDSELVGQEMPLGTFLILLALKHGIKKIGLVTDTNHHKHPASACIDVFGNRPFMIGDAKVFCTNQVFMSVDEKTLEEVDYGFLDTPEGKEKYPQQPDWSRKGLTNAKDWAKVVTMLCGEDKKEDKED